MMTFFSELYNQKRGQPGQAAYDSYSDDGAISVEDGVVFLTKGSAQTMTLAAPSDNGLALTIVCATAQAHVVLNTTPLFNGVGGTITFIANAGAKTTLHSHNGTWFGHTGTLATYS